MNKGIAKKTVFYILMVLFSLLIPLSLLEITARVLSHNAEEKSDTIRKQMIRHSSIAGVRYELNPGTYPYSSGENIPLKINSLGMRGEELDKNAKIKILVLGDSIVFARYLNYEDTGTYLLEKYLKEELKKDDIQVINAAMSGRSTLEELLFLESIYNSIKPSIVIMGICLNDFIDLTEDGGWESEEKHRLYFIKFLKDRLGRIEKIRVFKRWLLKAVYGSSAELKHVKELKRILRESEIRWAAWKAEFDRIKEFCDKSGSALIFTVFPFEPQAYSVPDLPELYRSYHASYEALSAYCRKNGIVCMDMLPYYRDYHYKTGERLYKKNDYLHPNKEGQLIWAKALSDYLTNKLK